MTTINANYKQIKNDQPLTLAIGNFDGIHIGHQVIVKKAKSFSDTKSGIMTFYPHPFEVIRKHRMYHLINLEQKKEILKQLGIDLFLIVEFTKEFSKLTVKEFIDFLKSINVKRLIIGRDFKFGYQGAGTTYDLEKEFEVIILPDTLYQSTKVSSTYVRNLLDCGDVILVKKLLNRHYSVKGVVIHGDKVGRTLGFPTANIDYDNYYLPLNGIYETRIIIDHKEYLGVCNIGHNPTINYSPVKRLEIFIVGFKDSLYQKEVEVRFISYLREEIKFDSKEELIVQIKKDVEQVISLAKKD